MHGKGCWGGDVVTKQLQPQILNTMFTILNTSPMWGWGGNIVTKQLQVQILYTFHRQSMPHYQHHNTPNTATPQSVAPPAHTCDSQRKPPTSGDSYHLVAATSTWWCKINSPSMGCICSVRQIGNKVHYTTRYACHPMPAISNDMNMEGEGGS